MAHQIGGIFEVEGRIDRERRELARQCAEGEARQTAECQAKIEAARAALAANRAAAGLPPLT